MLYTEDHSSHSVAQASDANDAPYHNICALFQARDDACDIPQQGQCGLVLWRLIALPFRLSLAE